MKQGLFFMGKRNIYSIYSSKIIFFVRVIVFIIHHVDPRVDTIHDCSH